MTIIFLMMYLWIYPILKKKSKNAFREQGCPECTFGHG